MKRVNLEEVRRTMTDEHVSHGPLDRSIEGVLPPCNHCGAKAKIVVAFALLHRVVCTGCGMMTPACAKLSEAVGIWMGKGNPSVANATSPLTELRAETRKESSNGKK
jgi:hypothetical protein